jgi:hypothetical protein
MQTSDWISAVALVIAAASLIYSFWSAHHERDDRNTQLDLLRRQVEGEAAARDRALRANVTASHQGGYGGVGDGLIEYELLITNAGPAIARDLAYRIRDSRDAEHTGRQAVTWLLPAGGEVHIRPHTRGRDEPQDLFVVVEWTDDGGRRETEVALPRPT